MTSSKTDEGGSLISPETRSGLRLIAAALLLLACWLPWFYTRTWVLLDVPISLARGNHYTSPDFVSNMSRRYLIELDAVVQRNQSLPSLIYQVVTRSPDSFKKLPCPSGTRDVSMYWCPTAPELKVHWVLTGGDEIEQGDLLENVKVGFYAWDSWIEKFQCKKGRRYHIDLDVLSDSGSLNVTDPHLYIYFYDNDYSSALVVTYLLYFICGIVILFGLYRCRGVLRQWNRASNLKGRSF